MSEPSNTKETLIMPKTDAKTSSRENRTICLFFSQKTYTEDILNPQNFRKHLDKQIELFQELFPPEISKGYRMKDIYWSKKQAIPIRRIEVGGHILHDSSLLYDALYD